MAKPATRFVVKRLNWMEWHSGRMARRPGEVAVASFATFDEAEAERARREGEYRERANPFECGRAVRNWTHLDEPRLRDWLMDHGVDPPEPKKDGAADWSAWWKQNQKKLGAEKRAAVWEALDKVRFFTVREEPARPVGYAVVVVNWEYNDEFYDANTEQGEVIRVFRTRERAEAECADNNDIARDVWAEALGDAEIELDDEDEEFAMFDMRDRLRRRRGLLPGEKLKEGEGLFRTTANVPFYEVIEVSLEGLE
ncbi:MAG: hypothetical protein J0I06_24670 [Planctomycetes bacterium]|nr:hypothetical protein [Planctomycetota bacterium]